MTDHPEAEPATIPLTGDVPASPRPVIAIDPDGRPIATDGEITPGGEIVPAGRSVDYAGDGAFVDNGDNAVAADAPRRRFDWPGFFGTLAFVLPVPAVLIGFLCLRMPPDRIMLAAASLVCGGVGLVRWARADLRGRRDMIAAMLIAAAVVAFAQVWNDGYLTFVRILPDNKEVFRNNMHRYFAPFYGRQRFSELVPSLIAIALMIGIWIGAYKWRVGRPMKWWGLVIVMLLQAVMIVALGYTDHGYGDGNARITGNSGGFGLFRTDAKYFRDIHELFEAYMRMMPRMTWLNQHYPPGPQLIFTLERIYKLQPLGGWVTTIFVCLSTPFIYAAACALTPKALARNAAVVVYATTSGVLLYPLISITPAVMLPGAIAAWAFVRGLRGPVAAVLCGVVLGASMYAFTILSFSSFFFIMTIGFVWLACVNYRVNKLLTLAILPVVAGATFVGIHLVVRKHLHFDIIATSLVGTFFHRKQMNSNGYDSFGEWFMRSTANLLAYVLANLPLIGLMIATIFAWRREDGRRVDRLLLPAAAVSIVIAAFCTVFYLETERIWILFLPLIALGGGAELAREDSERDVRRMVVMATLFAVAQELIFIHGVL